MNQEQLKKEIAKNKELIEKFKELLSVLRSQDPDTSVTGVR